MAESLTFDQWWEYMMHKGHGCRAEPHCVCGDNAWYHEDDEPGRCGMQGCPCQAWRRCVAFLSCLGLPARVPENKN